MFAHDIRWYALLPVSILMGLAALFAETTGVWGRFPARPDWLWCLAFYAALKAPPVSSMLVFAWCGVARGFFLGPRPGAAAIAFILVGWGVIYWKPLASERGWLSQAMAVGASSFSVAMVKYALDAGRLAPRLWESFLFQAVGDAILTGLLYIPVAVVLSLPSFRPWRERRDLFWP